MASLLKDKLAKFCPYDAEVYVNPAQGYVSVVLERELDKEMVKYIQRRIWDYLDSHSLTNQLKEVKVLW